MNEQKQPAEVGPVELVLGPLPETDVLAIGSLDMREDVEAYSAEAMEAERQRCYALGVAAERERMRAAIADDAYAATFQSIGQYRSALLRALMA